LVGNGLSMVTLCYLRRFLVFTKPLFDSVGGTSFSVSAELHQYFVSVAAIFEHFAITLPAALTNQAKKNMLDELGEASSTFRTIIYANHFSGHKLALPGNAISKFIATALTFIDHSIHANRREDGLYHTYNLLSYDDRELEISPLSEMLEGQVAVLSSGYLSPAQSLEVLNALKESTLYRQDQDCAVGATIAAAIGGRGRGYY
jgi:hypothetical protein